MEDYRKVKPRETFNPPVTPAELTYIAEFELLRDKLKHEIRQKIDVDQILTLCRVA